MEIKKLELNIEKRRKGIINVYLIPKISNINSYYLVIDEYDDKYVFTVVNNETLSLLDLASAIYEFVISNYFCRGKSFVYADTFISIEKDSPYPIVYQSLQPIFEK